MTRDTGCVCACVYTRERIAKPKPSWSCEDKPLVLKTHELKSVLHHASGTRAASAPASAWSPVLLLRSSYHLVTVGPVSGGRHTWKVSWVGRGCSCPVLHPFPSTRLAKCQMLHTKPSSLRARKAPLGDNDGLQQGTGMWREKRSTDSVQGTAHWHSERKRGYHEIRPLLWPGACQSHSTEMTWICEQRALRRAPTGKGSPNPE